MDYKPTRKLFWITVFASLVLSYVPYLSLPFYWVSSTYHFLAHGFAGLVTGGYFDFFEIYFDGTGYTETRNGITLFVAGLGYIGPLIIGGALYYGATTHLHNGIWVIGIVNMLTTVSMIAWATGFLAYTVMSVLSIIFFVGVRDEFFEAGRRIIAFIGMFMMINTLMVLGKLPNYHAQDAIILVAQYGMVYRVYEWIWAGAAISLLFIIVLSQERERSTMLAYSDSSE